MQKTPHVNEKNPLLNDMSYYCEILTPRIYVAIPVLNSCGTCHLRFPVLSGQIHHEQVNLSSLEKQSV